MYMQKADGSDKWESFAIEEFIPYIEETCELIGNPPVNSLRPVRSAG
jgi:hypothetical protein